MHRFLYIIFIFTYGLPILLQANIKKAHDVDKHNAHSVNCNELMIAYQFGYTQIHSKDRHMPDDSGAFLGIHLMKPIENRKFNSNIYLAAGGHTTLTDDRHVGLMLGIMYSINETTMISIMPGLVFMNHGKSHSNMGMGHMSVANNESKTEEAIHIEISHTITLLNRILNPSFSWMSSSSHNQYSLGLNFHF